MCILFFGRARRRRREAGSAFTGASRRTAASRSNVNRAIDAQPREGGGGRRAKERGATDGFSLESRFLWRIIPIEGKGVRVVGHGKQARAGLGEWISKRFLQNVSRLCTYVQPVKRAFKGALHEKEEMRLHRVPRPATACVVKYCRLRLGEGLPIAGPERWCRGYGTQPNGVA